MNFWEHHHRVQLAAQALRAGAVVGYPTEAVWGLGCDPFCLSAVARILAMKRRDASMGLILIAASVSQLEPFLKGLTESQRLQLAASWPGPNTWLIPDNGTAPGWITGGRSTLAVRVTDHPLAAALCKAFGGPLVSTSANPHGLPPAKSALKLKSYFRGSVDDLLPGQVGSAAKPTRIRDLITGDTIRPGA
ncbi:MAG: Sua5/YciO/YrdC/YwlC family protein [Pseudomonadales bacterium]|nr:Sua5/YciO/YrdC/YwlC family protein [Pseudomonadales bacterium]MCP5172963.1 Sua5/YciO/YrdC/YwlC family protein [Pseudomonadales bacterium]MCP5302436.1 Sua5/YciO/YrdC/YwlC family protein [Pseudomonadales bacterium]